MAESHHVGSPDRRAGASGASPRARRRRLAGAAAELTRRSGRGAVTVAALAEATDGSPADLAAAFGDLEACLRYGALEGHRLLTAPLHAVAAGDWRTRLQGAIDAYYGAIAAEPALAALHLLHPGAACLRDGDPDVVASVSAFGPFLAAAAAESGQEPLPPGVEDFLAWAIVANAVRELRAARAGSLPAQSSEVAAWVALFYTTDEERWGPRRPATDRRQRAAVSPAPGAPSSPK